MIEDQHDGFYLQRVKVSNRLKDVPRLDAFKPFCEGKTVLHMGCSQYPNTNPATNLHVQLAPFCKVLDGYDVATESYDILRPYVSNGRLLTSLKEARHYDVVLIPEVLEHVPNVEEFLNAMSDIPTDRYVITVPDLFQCYTRHFELTENDGLFLEAVHPDHNCWYSPYTITNTLNKYTDWRIDEICWFNRISLFVSATPGVR